jgi:hypothetical protein
VTESEEGPNKTKVQYSTVLFLGLTLSKNVRKQNLCVCRVAVRLTTSKTTVQYSTVQYSTVQYSTVQYSTVH